jgi:dienelactone hydrolase
MTRNALAALAAAAVLFLAGPAAAAAQEDFYATPSQLPQTPGEIIRSEPMTAYDAGRPLPGRAWRVLYRSTSALGMPIAVSGTVFVPDGDYSGPRPIIGYSVGTRGIADRCAPSRQLPRSMEPEAATVRSLLEQGWAVALTDWQGLGTAGDHTYVVGRAEGQAVLDAIRAARRLPAAGLPADGPLAVMGYSQGGHSTAWAAQVQPDYAPELRLAGAAAGAVPSDLRKVAAHLDGGYAAGLVIYAAVGMNAAYPELQLDRYLNDAGRDAVARARNSCLLDGSLALFAFRRSTDYTTTNVPELPEWRARLEENGVGGIAPQAPVLLYHARADELIPFELSEALRAKWCRGGVNVRLQATPGVDHSVTGSDGGAPVAIDWLAARFAKGPPPQPADCPVATRRRAALHLTARRTSRRVWRVDVRVAHGPVRDLVVTLRSPRGRTVARASRRSVSERARVRLTLRRRARPGRYRVRAVAFAPDGAHVSDALAVRVRRAR